MRNNEEDNQIKNKLRKNKMTTNDQTNNQPNYQGHIDLFTGITSERDAMRVMDETIQQYLTTDSVLYLLNGEVRKGDEILRDVNVPISGFQPHVFGEFVKNVRGNAGRVNKWTSSLDQVMDASSLSVSLKNKFDQGRVIAYWTKKGMDVKPIKKSVSVMTPERNFLALYGLNTLTVAYGVRDDTIFTNRAEFDLYKKVTANDDITKLFK